MESFVIAIVAILAATLIICLPIILVFWAVGRRRAARSLSPNEEERLKRLWANLQKMQQRVENLETILTAQRRGGTYDNPYQNMAGSDDLGAGRNPRQSRERS